MPHLNGSVSRRRAFALGGSIAAGLVAASSPLLGTAGRAAAAASPDTGSGDAGGFSQPIIKAMEQILQTTASPLVDVLSFELDRDDLTGYTIGGQTIPTVVPFLPSWENNGSFFFQQLSDGRAILNGDFGGLLPQEIDPFIDQLLTHGLVFQAFHMHLTDIHPTEVYFIHFRGVGDPLALAQGVIAAVRVTSTPLPQFRPSTLPTPLPVDQLAHILGGPASVGSDGVVTVYVPRRDHVLLGGIPISRFLNIATTISFEPLDPSGTTAAVVPDFSMVASEIQNVVTVMRQMGWVIGCLYNQETDEQPQLYFSHQLKVGDPVTLAQEVRKGLDQTNSVGS